MSGPAVGGGSGRRRTKEEHQNYEAWAIPYADLLTLLLAFFVVMYSISSLNEGKYRVMSDSLAAAFRGQPMREMPIAINTQGGLPTPNVVTLPNAPGPGSTQASRTQIQPTTPSLAQIGDNVARAMADLVIKDEVIIRKHEDWLEVEIKNDVLFPSGSATLTPKANEIVRKLGETLAGIPNPIFVEGHTDNVPISRVVFPSNWELSTARASAVIRLLAAGGITPTQLTALGFGEYRPTQSNETVEGRAANRRVMLAILAPERSGQSLYSLQGLQPETSSDSAAPMSFAPATGPSALPKAPPR
jgi:chemotaxis protein MotB